jgi:hypothetical protein
MSRFQVNGARIGPGLGMREIRSGWGVFQEYLCGAGRMNSGDFLPVGKKVTESNF